MVRKYNLCHTLHAFMNLIVEQLVLKQQHNEKHNWEKDYDKYVIPLVEENQPCYILYR